MSLTYGLNNMPVPVIAAIVQGLQANQQLTELQNQQSQDPSQIMQKRHQRQAAAHNILPQRNPTGLAGIDALSEADNRQMEIFNNFMSRAKSRIPNAGGMLNA